MLPDILFLFSVHVVGEGGYSFIYIMVCWGAGVSSTHAPRRTSLHASTFTGDSRTSASRRGSRRGSAHARASGTANPGSPSVVVSRNGMRHTTNPLLEMKEGRCVPPER